MSTEKSRTTVTFPVKVEAFLRGWNLTLSPTPSSSDGFERRDREVGFSFGMIQNVGFPIRFGQTAGNEMKQESQLGLKNESVYDRE